MTYLRTLLVVQLALLLCFPPPSLAGRGYVYVERAYYAMGSLFEVKLYCQSRPVCDRAAENAYGELRRLDRLLSDYRSDSTLAYVHREAHGRWVSVPREFAVLLALSFGYTALTAGAFDVTVAPVFRLWKEAQRKGVPPSAEEIARALSCIGPSMVETDWKRSRLRLVRPCVRLDFGAIGKGYAVDRAARLVKDGGIERGILNFSGTIYVLGPPPGRRGWVVEVKDPSDAPSSHGSSFLVDSGAVSTSGGYEKHFDMAGKRYSHIIDPRTGLPVRWTVSVTVTAPTATEADALSTAFSVMGPADAVALAESLPGVEVQVLEGDGSSVSSSGFGRTGGGLDK